MLREYILSQVLDKQGSLLYVATASMFDLLPRKLAT